MGTVISASVASLVIGQRRSSASDHWPAASTAAVIGQRLARPSEYAQHGVEHYVRCVDNQLFVLDRPEREAAPEQRLGALRAISDPWKLEGQSY